MQLVEIKKKEEIGYDIRLQQFSTCYASNYRNGAKTYCITYTAEGVYKPELYAYELKVKLEVTEPTIKDYFIGIDWGGRVKKCFGDYIPDFRKKREKRHRGW